MVKFLLNLINRDIRAKIIQRVLNWSRSGKLSRRTNR
jgi:hypothetical protein